MGIRNIIALAVHPIMALMTSLVFVMIASLQPVSQTMQYVVIVTGALINLGIIQALSLKEMLDLRASPTNFGQTMALLGLAVGLWAFADGGGTPWISPSLNRTMAISMTVIVAIECISRLVFMTRIRRHGSEAYARMRIERIMQGRMCNWNAKIDGLIGMSKGRSIIHDRHARHLAEAARQAMTPEEAAATC